MIMNPRYEHLQWTTPSKLISIIYTRWTTVLDANEERMRRARRSTSMHPPVHITENLGLPISTCLRNTSRPHFRVKSRHRTVRLLSPSACTGRAHTNETSPAENQCNKMGDRFQVGLVRLLLNVNSTTFRRLTIRDNADATS